MCGLIGFVGEELTLQSKIEVFKKTMIASAYERGMDATGIVFENKDKFSVYKKGVSADEFFELKKINNALEKMRSKFLFGHVRHGTGGSKKDNNNNHPIVGLDWTILHNGVVNMEDIKDYKYKGETDTERIVAALDTYGLEKGLAQIRGGASLIILNNTTHKIYLWRHANPLKVIWDKGLLVLISEEDLYSEYYNYVDIGINLKGGERKDLFIGQTEEEVLYELDVLNKRIVPIKVIEAKKYYVPYAGTRYDYMQEEDNWFEHKKKYEI